MTEIQEVLESLNTFKKNNYLLSKKEIIEILEAAKCITKHKDLVNSLIFFCSSFNSENQSKIKTLTKRELQIFELIGNGEKSTQIADSLNLKPSTVETHRKNIIKKIGLVGKGKLIKAAIIYNLTQTYQHKKRAE